MARAGLEPNDVSSLSNKGLRQSEKPCHAECHADKDAAGKSGGVGSGAVEPATDPQQQAELWIVQAAWPKLPQNVRKQILGLIAKESVKNPQQGK